MPSGSRKGTSLKPDEIMGRRRSRQRMLDLVPTDGGEYAERTRFRLRERRSVPSGFRRPAQGRAPYKRVLLLVGD